MTNQSKTELNRRTLLAGIGGLGVAGIGYGQLRTANRRRTYTHYTYAQPDGANVEVDDSSTISNDVGPRIRVSWYSTYNGHLLTGAPLATNGSTEEWDYENVDGYVADVDGPAIQVNNVLPGDSGTASIGLLAEEADARVWLRISPSCGTTEGSEEDCPPLAENPLANAIETELWYDTGIFGLFGCQGAEESSFGEPIAEGVLGEMPTVGGVDGSVFEGIELNPGVLDNSVLEEGDRLCLALAWAFPTILENVNDLQGTSVAFDIEFRAVAADDPTNPFAVDGETEVTA
ncbi:hypothetical protein AArcSl_2078 [Halalkaliarchaeum desulfuricum]|uniref:Uncharacterized protein n=1 Tax=Halalkaliarchaeum desulfuricum TaxID=2055893 RepID=A0A343TKT1_9EURY|nr:hypothetical protein [Halalkaliarchaeum desulfuricum]AUX09703.1 hypothetical protein AArcSl_2078 [Halalkaliarchaeum desulfuricum]